MIDVTKDRPIKVSHGGDTGPYIMMPVEQVEKVTALLDEHGVLYWVDETAISLDGRPAITVINLKFGTNAAEVQEILDNAD